MFFRNILLRYCERVFIFDDGVKHITAFDVFTHIRSYLRKYFKL